MIKAVMVAGQPFKAFFNFEINSNPIVPLPLAGFSAKCELRNQREQGNVLLSVTNDSPFFERDNDGGQLILKIPASSTINFDFKKAVLDVWITDGATGVRTESIEITFHRGVTRG